MRDVVILSAVRTPIGRFLGALAGVPSPRLGAAAIREAVARAGIDAGDVGEVIMGNVLPAGVGQAPARQAALAAGIPQAVGATTVNKMCGSGLKAAMLGTQAIQAGDAEVIVAGGMENMSQAPYYLERARTGYRYGHGQVMDAIVRDGLTDPHTGYLMGTCAEILNREYRITREAQDEFAATSYRRALAAAADGTFAREIVPVEVRDEKGRASTVSEDEEPKRVDFDKIATLKAAFEEGGSVTVANASSNSDGGAALVLASAEYAQREGLRPLARVVGQAGAARAPEWFTIAPAYAIRDVLARTGWTLDDVDLFEINEAFAAVVLGVTKELDLDLDRVNVHGGAVALGHPVGASGARIVATLLNAMHSRDARRGVAAICLAGGEAVAMAVERV